MQECSEGEKIYELEGELPLIAYKCSLYIEWNVT